MLRFSVEHKGILDVEGPANKGATKDVQSNIFGDKVVVRGRLSFARHTSKNHAEHLKSIESCGCDTPYNKPYRPLGKHRAMTFNFTFPLRRQHGLCIESTDKEDQNLAEACQLERPRTPC